MMPWAAEMDFGVVHPLVWTACRDGAGPILETYQVIVEDGMFGAIEIAPIRDPAIRERARDLLVAAGLHVVYLPILPIIFEDLGIASADSERRQAARQRLQQLIDEAISFNAPLAMVTGPRDPGPAERAATTARLVEDLQFLCDYADARSTRQRLHLTFEHFDRDVEKRRLIGPTAEAVALCEAVDRDNFGLTLDLSHLPLLGETAGAAIALAAPHIIHAHIGNCVIDDPDCPFYGDFHPRFDHPQGRNGVPEIIDFLAHLRAAGYFQRARQRLGTTPILSMELRPNQVDCEAPGTILANGKRYFTRAWAALTHQPSSSGV